MMINVMVMTIVIIIADEISIASKIINVFFIVVEFRTTVNIIRLIEITL